MAKPIAYADLYLHRYRPDGTLISAEIINTISIIGLGEPYPDPYASHGAGCVNRRDYFTFYTSSDGFTPGQSAFSHIRQKIPNTYVKVNDVNTDEQIIPKHMKFDGHNFVTITGRYIKFWRYNGTIFKEVDNHLYLYYLTGIARDDFGWWIGVEIIGGTVLGFFRYTTAGVLKSIFSLALNDETVYAVNNGICLGALLSGSDIDINFYRIPQGKLLNGITTVLSPTGTPYLLDADWDGKNWLVFWDDRYVI